jgi:hypothetical protein
MLIEVVNRADETVAIQQRIRVIAPKTAEARRRGRLTRTFQTRQCVRSNVANPTRREHGNDVSGCGMPLAHT